LIDTDLRVLQIANKIQSLAQLRLIVINPKLWCKVTRSLFWSDYWSIEIGLVGHYFRQQQIGKGGGDATSEGGASAEWFT